MADDSKDKAGATGTGRTKSGNQAPRNTSRKISDGSGRGRPRVEARISVEELRAAYHKQLSLGSDTDTDKQTLFDPMEKCRSVLGVARGETGVLWDDRMAEPHCLWDDDYPECPARYTSVINRCQELGLLNRCTRVSPRVATTQEITKLHSERLHQLITSTAGVTDADWLEDISAGYNSIYIHPKTSEMAELAAGGTVAMVEAVVTGTVHNGMAIVRPPGHHAMHDTLCGYCYYNNVAIAARHALDNLGVNRILIVDWDVHHGQGTQQMFYGDDRVMYLSAHRYQHGAYWPELRESDFDHVGEGAGLGYNCNVALNATGLGNLEYLSIWTQLLLPLAYQFCPDLVLVSAGYDSALGDEKGLMRITPAFYGHMTSMLMPLAGGKLVVALEGGYCLDSLAEGAALTLRTLMGDPCPILVDPLHGEPHPSLSESVLNTITVLRGKWRSLQYQGTYTDAAAAAASTVVDNDTPAAAAAAAAAAAPIATTPDTHAVAADGPAVAADAPAVAADAPTPAALVRHNVTLSKPQHIPIIKYLGSPPPAPYGTRNCYAVLQSHLKAHYVAELARLKADTNLQTAGTKLVYAYDARMEAHHCQTKSSHPERAARTREIMKLLLDRGLLQRMTPLTSRFATREELLSVHSKELVQLISSIPDTDPSQLHQWEGRYTSVYFNRDTYTAASLAAGSLMQVVSAVVSGESSRGGVAIIRPPGHHAEHDQPNGFCIFNNVAIATKHALDQLNLSRILIVDWDIHHGNGIQHTFYSDPRVLYVSMHLYKNATFFPNSTDADLDKLGEGEGRGYNINIPWQKGGVGDAEYLAAVSQVVLPVGYQFAPQLVIISAGFDAAVNDPVGGCSVSPQCFGHMTQLLSSLAGGRLVLALEGGYNIISTSYSLAACVSALLGDAIAAPEPPLLPAPHAAATINAVLDAAAAHWPVLAPYRVDLPAPGTDISIQKEMNGASTLDCPWRRSGHREDAPPSAPTDRALTNSESERDKLVVEMADMTLDDCGSKADGGCSAGGHPSVDAGASAAGASATGASATGASATGASATGASTSSACGTSTSGACLASTSGASTSGACGASTSGASGVITEEQLMAALAAAGKDGNAADAIRRLLDAQAGGDATGGFMVDPAPWCPHLETAVSSVPASGLTVYSPCWQCERSTENWCCLKCYTVGCGRHEAGHLLQHSKEHDHPLALSYSDLSVWCYECQTYVHNKVLLPAKQSAYASKFDDEMPVPSDWQ